MIRIDAATQAIEQAPELVRGDRFLLEWYRENGDRVLLVVYDCTVLLIVNNTVNEIQHAATPAHARAVAMQLQEGDTIR